jgi:hypothetical protein
VVGLGGADDRGVDDGSGIVIASQAGQMIPPLPPEQNEALARTPADELAGLPFLQPPS